MARSTVLLMTFRTMTLSAVTAIVGLGVAGVGYDLMTSSPTASAPASVPATSFSPAEQATTSAPGFRDCPRGFEQRRRECVRIVERTVVVDVAAAAAGAAAAAVPTLPGSTPSFDHDGFDDEGVQGDDDSDDRADGASRSGDEAGDDHGRDHDEADDEGDDEAEHESEDEDHGDDHEDDLEGDHEDD